MIAVAAVVGLLPILRTLAADYPSKPPSPPVVVYASLTSQADEDRQFMHLGVVCSVVYAVVAVIPVCRWPMTTRRWMLASAIVAGVIWLELSLCHWLLPDGMWPGTIWALLQLPLGLVLGLAMFLWYVLKWLRSPVPPDPPEPK
jgi:hypothetical protein